MECLSLTLTPEKGADVHAVLGRACYIADVLGVNVCFVFDGMFFRVDADTALDSVLEKYYKWVEDKQKIG